jgi:dTDP-4-dehydrorhamnose 3,5-epimerase
MSKFAERPIDGVIVQALQRHQDPRGWLIELFRHDDLDTDHWPVMSYISETLPGVARGPHEHRDQTDLFCFLGPSTFRLYLWENRPNPPTPQARMVIEAGQDNPQAVIIPPGVVHGYRNIGSVPGWVVNCANRLYAGEGRREKPDEIRYESDEDCPFVME